MKMRQRILFFIIIFISLCSVSFATFASHGGKDDYDEHRVNPTFKGWLSALEKEARVKGISQKTLDVALKGVRPIPRVIELDRSQPEFKWTFEKYYKKVVDDRRIKRGRKRYADYRELLAKIESKYGVQSRFLVALWGIETDFGRITGGFSVIDALVTLAFDGRRASYFRRELLNALMIIDQGHVTKKGMIGSWAGAMGQTQFMPSTFLSFAVDYTGDGKKDVWKARADALASGANYLSKSGWKPNQTWGREVKVPKDLDESLIDIETNRPLSEWRKLGITGMDGKPVPNTRMDAALINLDGKDGRYFLVYNNYHVIMKWNKSTSFATAVGLLSDAIAQQM
jgi:membrane-bound lytic murein transglycosylase B